MLWLEHKCFFKEFYKAILVFQLIDVVAINNLIDSTVAIN